MVQHFRKKGKRVCVKLTQEVFAEEINMTVSAISKIEVGNRVPSVDTFVVLAEFFWVTLDYLVLGKE